MGTRASDDLFQLIKAMRPGERRAFRLLSERYAKSEGNNYLALYDAIAAQESYDEAAIRQKFAGAGFLRNLSEAKSYLYKSLLRCLRFIHGPESPETELRELLDHLELLFEKGLMQQAERQVKAGLSQAIAMDLHAFQVEFIRWQRRLVKWRAGKQQLQEMAALGDAEAAALRHLSVEARLRDLMGRIQTILSQQADLVGEQRLSELRAIMADPCLQQPPVEAGFHALSSYHYAHAYFQRAMGNGQAAMEAWQAVVATFEDHPVHVRREPDQYSNALVALIDAQIDNRRYLVVPELLEQLRAMHPQEPGAVARLFFLGQHLSLRFALVTGQLGFALRLVPELEAGMSKHSKFLSAGLEMTLLYNVCALYFLSERYPEAQRALNVVLNRPHLPLREDIVDALQLLEMIARYARGQIDVLEHLYRANERRLRQRTVQLSFAQLAHQFIGKLMGANDSRETKRILSEMDEEMQRMSAQGKPAGFEELHYWVRSRISGERMEDILRREAANMEK